MKRKLGALLILALLLQAVGFAPVMAETTVASAKIPLYTASSEQRNNIALAVSAIDGTTVSADGGFFSFNDAVGPRTASYGYQNALNGRGVKTMGGGVAQVASTLYLALKKCSDITFEEKQTYGAKYCGDYVTSSRDAILVDYKAGVDFSFYNQNDDSLRIDLWTSENYLHCALVSADGTASGGEGYATLFIDGNSQLKHNITLAADSIYDITLEPGDVFSFNDIVGPRTPRYGYKTAVNGRGVQVPGGGVAQVASVIYLAVRDMGCVTMIDKTTYGGNYNQHYVDNADDAIAVDYTEGMDFSFRYDGYATLALYTYVDDDVLYCEATEA